MLPKKTKLRWVIPFLLIGAAGCAKVDLPRAGKSATNKLLGGASALVDIVPVTYSSAFEKSCAELPGMNDVPQLVSLQEYGLLSEFIKTNSALLAADKDRFVRAHVHALKTTNHDVMWFLEKNQKTPELKNFKANLSRFVDYNHPNTLGDLQQMISRVMEVSETGKCASAYLAHFYSDFVKELDAYGDVSFGLTENKALDDTLFSQPVLPDEIRNAPPHRLQGTVMLVTLPKFSRSSVLDIVLHTLEQGFAQQTYGVILLDLRYSGGYEIPLLPQIKASAMRGWGNKPIVLLVNRLTRGMANVVAQQLSSHPNVLVLGEDDETYGFGRKLTQQSTVLAPGLSPLTLTIGSEYLPPVGLEARADNYRLHLTDDNVLGRKKGRDKDKTSLDLAVERAEQWSTQAPLGDFAPVPVAVDANIASAEAQPADSSVSVDAGAPPAGQSAAGQVATNDPALNGDPSLPSSQAPLDPAAPAPAVPTESAPAPAPIQPPADMPAATAMSSAAPRSFGT